MHKVTFAVPGGRVVQLCVYAMHFVTRAADQLLDCCETHARLPRIEDAVACEGRGRPSLGALRADAAILGYDPGVQIWPERSLPSFSGVQIFSRASACSSGIGFALSIRT